MIFDGLKGALRQGSRWQSGVIAVLLSGLMLIGSSIARADLLVVSQSNSTVRRFSNSGADLGIFVAAGSGGLNNATGLSIRASDNSLLVTSFGTNSIKRYSGTDGSYLGDFATGLSGPTDNLIGADGNLYVANFSNNSVARYNATTAVSQGTFVASNSGSLNGPEGLTFASNGDLLVSSANSGVVKRYDGTTGAYISDFASGLNSPLGSVFGPDGNFYVASYGDNVVKKYNGTNGAFISDFATTNLNGPGELIFGADNNLYVSNLSNSNVTRYDGTTGAFINIFATNISQARDMRFFTVTATPEPETWAMLLMGMGACFLWQRKRRVVER